MGMALPMGEPDGWVPEDTFGARLALVRHRHGWSADAAAEACGDLGGQNWRNWEAGVRPRDFQRITAKIAEATGVSQQWLTLGGPLKHYKFSLSMRPDLRLVPDFTEPIQIEMFDTP